MAMIEVHAMPSVMMVAQAEKRKRISQHLLAHRLIEPEQ